MLVATDCVKDTWASLKCEVSILREVALDSFLKANRYIHTEPYNKTALGEMNGAVV